MSRDIVKIFCPRNHRVGTVKADDDGLFIDYTGEVWHPDSVFGAPATMRLAEDDVTAFTAYCTSCRSPVELSVPGVRAAVRDREIHAANSISDDKSWVDAGWEPMYPPGLQWERRDHRPPTE